MASIDLYFPKMIKFEGGYCDVPGDSGGPTKYGVTLSEWRSHGYDKDNDGDIDSIDVKNLSLEDAKMILKVSSWDLCSADNIKSQSVAEIMVDWTYNSGSWGIRIPQRILRLKEDGIVGIKTITAINTMDPQTLFTSIKQARIKFYNDIVINHPDQKKFLKGWMNRINSFVYS